MSEELRISVGQVEANADDHTVPRAMELSADGPGAYAVPVTSARPALPVRATHRPRRHCGS